jgi:hypothetical protein
VIGAIEKQILCCERNQLHWRSQTADSKTTWAKCHFSENILIFRGAPKIFRGALERRGAQFGNHWTRGHRSEPRPGICGDVIQIHKIYFKISGEKPQILRTGEELHLLSNNNNI